MTFIILSLTDFVRLPHKEVITLILNKQLASKWREEEAVKRFGMISPLLDATLDDAKNLALREDIAEKNCLSLRTVYRYEKAYREGGFEALKPKERISRIPLSNEFNNLLNEAIQLRREVPSRSVEDIIRILEMEGRAAPGILKRSTLQKHLADAGFSERQMKMYKEAKKSSSKRFCKPHRMMLVQADLKYGLMLPIGKGGAKVQTYLSSAIDDHSRLILESRFYDNQEAIVVADTMRKAILRHGKMDAVYFDRGSQYIAKQLRTSLAMLGITVRLAPVRSGKSKGKIEKFHQVVDSFLNEAKAKKIRTLEALNDYWNIYLEEYYHKRPHGGIKEYYQSLGVTLPPEGISPLQEWNRDSRPLTFMDAHVVADAFLHHEERLVDKGGCISFQGRKYETKLSLIGCKVAITYDPMAPETITISYPGIESFEANPLKMKSFCDKTPALPQSIQEAEAETSRLLDGLAKKRQENRENIADAISFSGYGKEAASNV